MSLLHKYCLCRKYLTKRIVGEALEKLSNALRVLQNRWFYKKNLEIFRQYAGHAYSPTSGYMSEYERAELARMQNTYGDEEEDMDLDEEVIEIGDIDDIIDQMMEEDEDVEDDDEEDDYGTLTDARSITIHSHRSEDSLDYMPNYDPATFKPKDRILPSSSSKKLIVREASIKKEAAAKKVKPKMLNALDGVWKAPDVGKALKSLDYWHPRKGSKQEDRRPFDIYHTNTGRHCFLTGLGEQCDLWEEGMLSEFIPYGVGITNYFKFLKWLTWVFMVAAVISLPELVLNVYGSYGSSASDGSSSVSSLSSSGASTTTSSAGTSSGIVSLSMTTVGNLANTIQNGTISIPLPGCSSQLFGEASCQLHRNSVGTFYTSIDLAISLFILIAFLWLAYFERREEKEQLKKTYYASMFTVQVSNLPYHHQQQNGQEHQQDAKNGAVDTFTEQELRSYFNELLEGASRVHSIQVVHECEQEIENCKTRGKLLLARNNLLHQHRCDCTLIRNEKNVYPKVRDDKIKKIRLEFLKRLKKLDLEIKSFDESIKNLATVASEGQQAYKGQGKPLVAFVTFEERVGAMLAIDKHTTTLMSCLRRRDQQHRFKGKYVLSVQPAPEPAKIKWENLGYSSFKRNMRHLLTIVLAMLLVLVSVAITFSAKALQQSSVLSGGGTTLCPSTFVTMSRSDQLLEVSSHHEYVHCYCDQFTYQQQAGIPLCKHYLQTTIRAQVLTFFSSVVVLVVSTLIDMAIRLFADYEKHHTEDSKEKSIFLRVFILQYLNTSCVFLINNNNQHFLSSIFGSITGSGDSSAEFSSEWYTGIGVTIILVQLGNILSCQSNTIYQYFSYKFKLRRAWGSDIPALTQAELNKALIGPEFQLSTRYAQTLTTFFVCLTFSSGIPLLYFIAAANFYVNFWIDKYIFVTLCKEPKPYNAHMGKEATMLIPIGVAFHLAMSVWMLSNKEIFSSDVNEQVSLLTKSEQQSSVVNELLVKITFKQTVPLFALFCVILGVFLLYHVLKRVRSLLDVIYLFCVGDSEVKNKIEILQYIREKGVVETFSGLVYAGKMKGLTTYNILQNPEYKEAFGITWSFAFKHQRLKSLYNFKANELTKAIGVNSSSMDDEEEEDNLDNAMIKQHKIHRLRARSAAAAAAQSPVKPPKPPKGLIGSPGNTIFKSPDRNVLKKYNSELEKQAFIAGDIGEVNDLDPDEADNDDDLTEIDIIDDIGCP
jgi:hypothetical protein